MTTAVTTLIHGRVHQADHRSRDGPLHRADLRETQEAQMKKRRREASSRNVKGRETSNGGGSRERKEERSVVCLCSDIWHDLRSSSLGTSNFAAMGLPPLPKASDGVSGVPGDSYSDEANKSTFVWLRSLKLNETEITRCSPDFSVDFLVQGTIQIQV